MEKPPWGTRDFTFTQASSKTTQEVTQFHNKRIFSQTVYIFVTVLPKIQNVCSSLPTHLKKT